MRSRPIHLQCHPGAAGSSSPSTSGIPRRVLLAVWDGADVAANVKWTGSSGEWRQMLAKTRLQKAAGSVMLVILLGENLMGMEMVRHLVIDAGEPFLRQHGRLCVRR
jgi:hypothetical protein